MARRTSVTLVRALLGGNYGMVNGQLSDLSQYIDMATRTIDQVITLLARKSSSPFTLSAADYEMMERCTAAYYYTHYDPLFQQRSTEGASGGFVAEKLDANRYKAMAIQNDPTGILNALLNRTIAESVSLTKTVSERISWEDR